MPTDIAEMRDTAQQGASTGTTTPEHHQTQAATGAPAANVTASATPGGATLSGSMGSASTSGGASASMPSRRGGSPLSPFSMFGNPFGMMRSMMEQMDRLFEDFTGAGGGRTRSMALPPAPQGTGVGYGTTSLWYPQIEVSEKQGNLVVCADLPGLKKEDVQLEVHDDHLVLQGERRNESSQTEGGLYRTERSYGSFYRTIPLPDGVNPDQVRATFKDGVLEVTVPVPNRQQQLQGRRIEIT
jgi:HSP20 family protein